MSDITKKQHYVWRHYLGAWKSAKDDKDIWTGFLQSKVVKKVALTSVAQSSYFYRLEELTDVEIAFLKQYSDILSPQIQEVATILIAGYIAYTQIKREFVVKIGPTDGAFEHALKKIELSSFEAIQGTIERMGYGLLKCCSIQEIETLVNDDIYDVLFFLMVQYTRTKAMKERFVSSLTDRPHLQDVGRKSWPFWNIVTALQLVEGIAKENDYRFVYVKNCSSVPFITGDQPVINALGDIKDEKGDVKYLEVYYPLSPSTVLVIAFDSGKRFEEMDVDEVYVNERNSLIMKESQLHIFGNEEAVLNDLLH